jgi:hypothetical protein
VGFLEVGGRASPLPEAEDGERSETQFFAHHCAHRCFPTPWPSPSEKGTLVHRFPGAALGREPRDAIRQIAEGREGG